MAATGKTKRKTRKSGKKGKAGLRQVWSKTVSTVEAAPKTIFRFGDVVIWQPYMAYWRWGQKLGTEPREAIADIGATGRRAAAGVGRGAKWGIDRISRGAKWGVDRMGHYGKKVPGVKWSAEKAADGIRAVPTRLRLAGGEEVRKLNQAVDRLARKVDAMGGKA